MENGQTDLMGSFAASRLNLNVSINSLLCEIVCRFRIVFLVSQNMKHRAVCTVVLQTKIVVEFMFLYRGLQR